MKREQGDVARARFGRAGLVLLSHPDDIQRVLVSEDGMFPRLNVAAKRWRRSPRKEQVGVTLGPGGDPAIRLAFRRALQPTYSRARVDSYWPEFMRVAEEATATWRDGDTIDLVQEVDRLALDLVVRTVFGRPLDAPLDELVAWTHACTDLRSYASSASYRVADKLRLRRNLRAATAFDALERLLRRHLEERRAEQADADDVLSQLLEVEEAKDLGDEQLVIEALGQLFVGSEPVGSGASWVLYLLAAHADALASVRRDVHEHREKPNQLTVLRAVISETLRLHPPFTMIGRQARTDVEFGGVRVRAGDPVMICPYLVHRDERWWPHPTAFDPARWLDGAAAARPRLAYLPFGAGPRQCLGEHLAWRGIEATVAAIVLRWQLTPVGPPPAPISLRPTGLQMRSERL